MIDRLNTALADRYVVERELGEGGMAIVFLAVDLKHDRRVALKVLRPELAAVVGGERFLAEIKTTANLQHPNILPLFDSGEAAGFLYYVMPFVQGESLRERLRRERQLPVSDAKQICSELAQALDYAHREGVVHRDIKPANVLLLDGRPVIADFGIALAVGEAGGGRLTETGLSLGTPHYMSPEQATGDVVIGPASDIYALGCVLYEMLVGEPPFTGASAQAVLGKIMMGSPTAVTAGRPAAPLHFDAVVRKALAKIPADRFRSAMAFAEALNDPSFGAHEVGAAGPSGSRSVRWLAPAIGVLGLGLLANAVPWGWGDADEAVGIRRFDLGPSAVVAPALFHDGSGAVVGMYDADGNEQLAIRRWDDVEPVPLPETAALDLSGPSPSPDGRGVAYSSTDGLRVIRLDGGIDGDFGPSACCAHWAHDGYIYHSTSSGVGRVPEAGGDVESLSTAVDGEGHRDPVLSPDGEWVLFSVFGGDQVAIRIDAVHIESGERISVVDGARPSFSPQGHLVWGTNDGRIVAMAIDPKTLEPAGPVVPLADDLAVLPDGQRALSVANDGTLVYIAGPAGTGLSELVWMSRSGSITPAAPGFEFPSVPNQNVRLSPDGSRVALNYIRDGNTDVFVKTLPNGPVARLTVATDQDLRPFWDGSGSLVYYFSGPSNVERDVWVAPADGSGEPRRVLESERSFSRGEWHPAGLVLRSSATAQMGLARRGLYFAEATAAGGSDGEPSPLLATEEFMEDEPAVSPDGRLLAYVSDRGGEPAVYVTRFQDATSARIRVSTGRGRVPRWASSTELVFLGDRPTMMSAEVDPESLAVSNRQSLFEIDYDPNVPVLFDVRPGDPRILMVRPQVSSVSALRTRVVFNAFEEMTRDGG